MPWHKSVTRSVRDLGHLVLRWIRSTMVLRFCFCPRRMSSAYVGSRPIRLAFTFWIWPFRCVVVLSCLASAAAAISYSSCKHNRRSL